MSWRDKLGVFVLTKEEQRTIAFITLAVILGLATKHYRYTHPAKLVPPNDKQIVRSPSPNYSPGIRP